MKLGEMRRPYHDETRIEAAAADCVTRYDAVDAAGTFTLRSRLTSQSTYHYYRHMADNVIPMMSPERLEAKVRDIALNRPRDILFEPDGAENTSHVRSRMAERDITADAVIDVLRTGQIDGEPQRDEYGDIRIKVTGVTSGVRIFVIVAILPSNLLVVSTYRRGRVKP